MHHHHRVHTGEGAGLEEHVLAGRESAVRGFGRAEELLGWGAEHRNGQVKLVNQVTQAERSRDRRPCDEVVPAGMAQRLVSLVAIEPDLRQLGRRLAAVEEACGR